MATTTSFIPGFQQGTIIKTAPNGMRSSTMGYSVIIGKNAQAQFALPVQVLSLPDQDGKSEMWIDPYAKEESYGNNLYELA